MTWLFSALIVGLVGLYMTRPRYRKHRISAARFFRDLPPPRAKRSRLRFAPPKTDRHFWLQLAALLCLLAAVVIGDRRLTTQTVHSRLAVWLLVDTSASMTTDDEGKPRMAAAKVEANRVLDELRALKGDAPPILRISSFDLERRDLLETEDALPAGDPFSSITPRLLGTNLDLVRAALNQREDFDATNLVVITDQPAPAWLGDLDEAYPTVIWRHVGSSVDNLGITAIRAEADPLTGVAGSVSLSITAYGSLPHAALRVTGPNGDLIYEARAQWRTGNLWRTRFIPNVSGLYAIALAPEDAYPLDNHATVRVVTGNALKVDWRLADTSLPDALGWTQSANEADLRVSNNQADTGSNVPTLIVGDSRSEEGMTIFDFEENSPLLDGLNMDALEASGLRGQGLDQNFTPVLRSSQENMVLATQTNPPAVFVPGTPRLSASSDDLKNRVISTLFFNGIRTLLGDRPLVPPYTLTSVTNPIPEGTRLALHPGEGNTTMQPSSLGRLTQLDPKQKGRRGIPLWPFLLGLALLFLVWDSALR